MEKKKPLSCTGVVVNVWWKFWISARICQFCFVHHRGLVRIHVCNCNHRYNGDISPWGSTAAGAWAHDPFRCSPNWGGVCDLRLLWAHGGVHPSLYWADSGTVFWEVDLWPLRRGNQGWDSTDWKACQCGGGHDPAHELLQEVQVPRSSHRPDNPPDLSDEADPKKELGIKVNPEQPNKEGTANSR